MTAPIDAVSGLVEELRAHMGRAEVPDLLRDCRRAADALEAQARELADKAQEIVLLSRLVKADTDALATAETRIAALEDAVRVKDEALREFGDLADIFDHVAGNRPREGELMSWIDHRVGERVLTVEMLRRARALSNGEHHDR